MNLILTRSMGKPFLEEYYARMLDKISADSLVAMTELAAERKVVPLAMDTSSDRDSDEEAVNQDPSVGAPEQKEENLARKDQKEKKEEQVEVEQVEGVKYPPRKQNNGKPHKRKARRRKKNQKPQKQAPQQQQEVRRVIEPLPERSMVGEPRYGAVFKRTEAALKTLKKWQDMDPRNRSSASVVNMDSTVMIYSDRPQTATEIMDNLKPVTGEPILKLERAALSPILKGSTRRQRVQVDLELGIYGVRKGPKTTAIWLVSEQHVDKMLHADHTFQIDHGASLVARSWHQFVVSHERQALKKEAVHLLEESASKTGSFLAMRPNPEMPRIVVYARGTTATVLNTMTTREGYQAVISKKSDWSVISKVEYIDPAAALAEAKMGRTETQAKTDLEGLEF